MQLASISISNFRCFSEFNLNLGGDSVFLVGRNGAGKTTLLDAIQRALRGGSVDARDFRSLEEPLEIIVTITGISAADQSHFAEAMDFSESPPVLRVGFQAIWDEEEREPSSTHGFPDDGWKRIRRQAREALPILVLPAWRDPARLTSLSGRSSLFARLLKALPIEGEIDQAVHEIGVVGKALAAAAPIQDLLRDAGTELGQFLPDLPADPFSLKNAGSQPQDVLRQLELYLESAEVAVSVADQSAGLAQGAVFAMSLRELHAAPGSVVLIDEPEIALHPQAQRALVKTLRKGSNQSIVVTHSAAVLDRVDSRQVVRLKRSEDTAEAVRATGMSDSDARSLSRYATSQTAEAFFAKILVVVEGFSDLLALRTIAATQGKDLDALGVSLLSLDGAGTFKHYLQLFGPDGLDVTIHGLCDKDAEHDWTERLSAAGIPVSDRQGLEERGFYVCDPDLEDELLTALGSAVASQVIHEQGAEPAYNSFASQPANAGKSEHELHVAFFKREKVFWAPLFSGAIDATAPPQPISDLLARL